MLKKLFAITFIFGCTAIAWMILSAIVKYRTDEFDRPLNAAVGKLWGTPQEQPAPRAYVLVPFIRQEVFEEKGQRKTRDIQDFNLQAVPLKSSRIDVTFHLEHRQKGLMWYATYEVDFRARYHLANSGGLALKHKMIFQFPEGKTVFDNFRLLVDGREVHDLRPESGGVETLVHLAPGEQAAFDISYHSRGMDRWWYKFGNGVQQLKDFCLNMHTDFLPIDFPAESISPGSKTGRPGGWDLQWQYQNLLSGSGIGMEMPQKLNPGPWVTVVTATAPVSLFLFFFLVFLITSMRRIPLHAMHYFFIAAGFFSFHLLMAYLADHLSIHLTFFICACVSYLLVVSYMRLVAGLRFALVEIGLAQLVYQVFFSYTFFFKGFTGLAITILCILTLFVVMQATGRLDWGEIFRLAGENQIRPTVPAEQNK